MFLLMKCEKRRSTVIRRIKYFSVKQQNSSYETIRDPVEYKIKIMVYLTLGLIYFYFPYCYCLYVWVDLTVYHNFRLNFSIPFIIYFKSKE